MRFLLDANIPHSALEIFAEFMQKAYHVNDLGLGTATDEQVISYARKSRCILITRDLDFGTLAVFSRVPTYGIVTLRLPFSFNADRIKSKLREFLRSVDMKRLRNSITVVELDSYRVRKL